MASNKANLRISVLDEKGVIYYGDCASLTVPSESGAITVLPFHTPLIAKLSAGTVTIRTTSNEKQELATIERGLVYVGENEVSVLVGL